MSTVKKYMMRTLNSVSENDTLKDAVECMHKTEMSALPVVDDENKFMGTIYSKNILRNIIPEQYGFLNSHQLLSEINEAAENMATIQDRTVSEYMSTSAEAVNENDKMNKLANIMLNNKESVLFVVNKNGYLRGYISRADLLFYLLDVAEGKK